MVLSKQIEVSKEMSEVMSAVCAMVKIIKDGKAQGKSAVEISMMMVTGGAMPMMAAVEGIGAISNEAKLERKAFLNAVMVGGSELVDEILK